MVNKLTNLDYVFIFGMLMIPLFISIYQAFDSKRRRKGLTLLKCTGKDRGNEQNKLSTDDIKDFLTASSSMHWAPITFSLLSSVFSAIILLGVSSEVYQYGLGFYSRAIIYIFPPLIGAFFTGPFFSNLKVLSVFEYLELRFNSIVVRMIGVICYLIRSFATNSISILGPSITINALTNISITGCIIIISLTGTICTMIGGIRSVIWADLLQFIFMFFGMIAIIINGLINVGGVKSLWDINMKGGRLQLFDFDVNPFIRQSFWSNIIGNFVIIFTPCCLDQQMVQRFACAKNRRTAQVALLLNFPTLFISVGLSCFIGFILYATYVNCDPLAAPTSVGIRNPSQMLPFYVTDKFHYYIGIFVGTILVGSLNSISAVLNSLSAVLLQDFLRRFTVFNRRQFVESSITPQVLVFLSGLISMAIALAISKVQTNIVQISNSLIGALNGPIIGVFFLASLFKFVNSYGAVSGMLVGLVFSIWINLGIVLYQPKYPTLPIGDSCYNFTNSTSFTILPNSSKEASNLHGFYKIYSISYMYFGPISILLTTIFGVLISLLTGRHKGKVSDDLLLTKWKKWYNKKKLLETQTN